MNRTRIILTSVAAAGAGVIGVGAVAAAHDGGGAPKRLTGYQEVPALSTPGVGEFRASLSPGGDAIDYRLSFSGLETAATQAHIHFENKTNNGAIVVFLCSNLGNGPAGTPACPAEGTVSGTITPAQVIGPAAQGIAAGEFAELVRALRAGAAYANVHTTTFTAGEIRGQIGADDDDHHGRD